MTVGIEAAVWSLGVIVNSTFGDSLLGSLIEVVTLGTTDGMLVGLSDSLRIGIFVG